MRVSEIVGDRAETVVPIGGAGKIWVAYRPEMVTATLTDDLQSSQRGDDGPILRWLADTLLEWDCQGRVENGRLVDSEDTLGTDVDTLRVIPTKILLAILVQIQREQTVPELKSVDSGPS